MGWAKMLAVGVVAAASITACGDPDPTRVVVVEEPSEGDVSENEADLAAMIAVWADYSQEERDGLCGAWDRVPRDRIVELFEGAVSRDVIVLFFEEAC